MGKYEEQNPKETKIIKHKFPTSDLIFYEMIIKICLLHTDWFKKKVFVLNWCTSFNKQLKKEKSNF